MPQERPIDKSRAELFIQQCLKDDAERIKAKLSHTTVVIGIPKAVARTRNGQIGLVTATNIITRLGALVPNLYFDVPGQVKVLSGVPLLTPGRSLADSLLELTQALEKLQPGVQVRAHADRASCYTYGLFIGKVTVKTSHTVTVGADRWLAAIRPDCKPERVSCADQNPLGIILAAAMGSAEVIKHMWLPIRSSSVKIEPIERRVVVSAYDLLVNPKRPYNPSMPDSCELLHACMFGLGAIGSACMFILGCLPNLRMSLDLVDMDYIECSNEERLFTSSDPQEDLGKLKVVHAEDFIHQLHDKVNTFIYPMQYEKFVNESRERLGYVWCSLDSAKARRDLLLELPSVVCNGGTDASQWMFSLHEYGNWGNACMRDLYAEQRTECFDPAQALAQRLGMTIEQVHRWSLSGQPLDIKTVLATFDREHDPAKQKTLLAMPGLRYDEAVARVCSTMRPNEHVPAATISFVSLTPAVAMVADLVKRRLYGWKPKNEDPNVFLFDALSQPRHSKAMRIRANRGCLCQSERYRAAFKMRQRMREPYLNHMFRSASRALIMDNIRDQMKPRQH